MQIEYKHTLATRWAHWVNFPVIGIMIWSGLLIYWANDVYRIGVGSVTLFHFFPDWVYNTLHLDHALALGMAVHFLFMWFFALNGAFYVFYTIVSGEWRNLVPSRRSLREAFLVALHDLGLRRTLPAQSKYNAAQKIAYSGVIVMGAGSVISGLAIYKPVQLSWLTSILGGYEVARLLHFGLTLGYLGFFAIHFAQVVRAGWSNFSSMVAGFEAVTAGEGDKNA